MRLTELLTMEVVSEDGRHLGRVCELRSAGEPEHGDSRSARRITDLVYGKVGWLERLGFKAVEERVVAWDSVVALEGGRIVIKGEKGVE